MAFNIDSILGKDNKPTDPLPSQAPAPKAHSLYEHSGKFCFFNV